MAKDRRNRKSHSLINPHAQTTTANDSVFRSFGAAEKGSRRVRLQFDESGDSRPRKGQSAQMGRGSVMKRARAGMRSEAGSTENATTAKIIRRRRIGSCRGRNRRGTAQSRSPTWCLNARDNKSRRCRWRPEICGWGSGRVGKAESNYA